MTPTIPSECSYLLYLFYLFSSHHFPSRRGPISSNPSRHVWRLPKNWKHAWKAEAKTEGLWVAAKLRTSSQGLLCCFWFSAFLELCIFYSLRNLSVSVNFLKCNIKGVQCRAKRKKKKTKAGCVEKKNHKNSRKIRQIASMCVRLPEVKEAGEPPKRPWPAQTGPIQFERAGTLMKA